MSPPLGVHSYHYSRGAAMLAAAVMLAACGGGGSSSSDPDPTGTPDPTPTTTTLTGASVDGPIANAIVRVYRVDTTVPSLQGELLAEGTTDAQAQFAGLSVDSSETGPLLVVVTADDDTVDLNTGNPPIISEVRTIIPRGGVGEPAFATPLTSMAIALTVAKADDDGSVTLEEFEAGLDDAASDVVSALGFGMGDDVDIFSTPPLVTDDTDSDEELGDVAAYRTAISGAAAIVFAIEQNSDDGTDANDVLASLADDLSDGNIDGNNSENEEVGDYDGDDAATIVETDPTNLIVPGTNRTVEETEQLLDEETEQTGSNTDTDVTRVVVTLDTQCDGDAITDIDDAGILAGPHQNLWRLGREPLQVNPRGLVGAVLGPHHRVHGQFEMVGVPSEDPLDVVELTVGEPKRSMHRFGHARHATGPRLRTNAPPHPMFQWGWWPWIPFSPVVK